MRVAHATQRAHEINTLLADVPSSGLEASVHDEKGTHMSDTNDSSVAGRLVDPLANPDLASQPVTNDAVAGEPVIDEGSAGGPTGAEPAEAEPDLAENDLAGENIDLREEED
jgi:hypothetical protein